MDNIVVLKFGGSSMGDKDNLTKSLANILTIVQSYIDLDKKIIIVVSALAGETRRLKGISEQLFKPTDLKSSDAILAMGEIFSSTLLENFLSSKNIKVIGLNNDKLPILTDSNHGNATIIKVKLELLTKYLQLGYICIVPGYIGKDENENVTTLGFDGSDTTAIAISGAINANMCYLFKDVDGVFSANPRRVEKARKIKTISYENMYAFSLLGARIIHPKAVEIAYKNNFPITILPNFNPTSAGTLINNNAQASKDECHIVGVTYYPVTNNEIKLAIVGSNLLKYGLHGALEKFLTSNTIGKISTDNTYLSNAIVIDLFKENDLNQSLIKLHTFLGLDDENNPQIRLNPNAQTYFDPAFKNQS